jgi:inosine/xanthosine triphosphatase
MKTIVVASNNPVKIQAALRGFQRLFPDEAFTAQPVSVPSGVSDQPMSSEETRRGALNRAGAARQALPEGDYWVGIEGGVESEDRDLAAFAWIAVLSQDRTGQSRTGTFFLPASVSDLVRQGKELGEADDIVFGRSNSKQDNGAIGILTSDVIDRTDLYEHAVVLALVAFKNPALYGAEE